MNEQLLSGLQITGDLSVPYIPEAGYADTMRETVEPWLASLREEREVAVSGGTLHTESYILPGAKLAVLMLHGYTESAQKLREMAWYFLKAGFSVFSYDHRGNGRSLRHVADESITHVNRFSDYVENARRVLKDLVLPRLNGAQLCLYGHSMGGAVSAHLLQAEPDTFVRCVLTSPMIMPATADIPLWAALGLTGGFCAVGQGKRRAFVGKPFDPAYEVFERSCSTSVARFEYYRDKRVAHRYFQNCSPTYGWTRQAILQNKALMDPAKNAPVKLPVLLMQAALDDVVLLPPQDEYIRLLPNGRLIRMEGGKHELFNSTDDVMQPYVRHVVRFLMGMKEDDQ